MIRNEESLVEERKNTHLFFANEQKTKIDTRNKLLLDKTYMKTNETSTTN